MNVAASRFRIQSLDWECAQAVGLSGEFDAGTVAEFEAHFAEHVPTGAVLICLQDTTIIDSSALGAVLRLRSAVDVLGHQFEVHRPREFQRQLFAITGLNDILTAPAACPCQADHADE